MKKLLIAAHTKMQFERFCRVQHLHHDMVQRVSREDDLRGYRPETMDALVLLPMWQRFSDGGLRNIERAVREWRSRKGKAEELSEHEAETPQLRFNEYRAPKHAFMWERAIGVAKKFEALTGIEWHHPGTLPRLRWHIHPAYCLDLRAHEALDWVPGPYKIMGIQIECLSEVPSGKLRLALVVEGDDE